MLAVYFGNLYYDKISLSMEIRGEIEKEILGVLKSLGVDEKKIIFSSEISHADFSTNAAMTNFHKTGGKFKNPLEFAEYIAQQLQKKLPNIEKVEASAPGFLNFFLGEKTLLEKLDHIVTHPDGFGKGSSLKDQKIVLEFADPNPFKEFHIGHLRNITLGESFARLLEFSGGDVIRANYQGDVGMHVAKAVYGLRTTDYGKLTAEKLGEAYAAGAKAYEEDENAKKEIQEINLKIYKKSDPDLMKLWEEGRKISLEHFEEIYKRVGTKYDKYYFESQTEEPGRELVLANVGKVFEKDEGAVVFRGKHTRVFVTSDGYATYEGKDLALAKLKYEDFKFDRSIIITANEQEQYFRVVLEAMEKVLPEIAAKTSHYAFGFVNLRDGKMSSRSGNVVAGEWLLDEAKKRLQENFKEMDSETLEKVAVGAVKYSMLKFSRKSDITFSFEDSISLEGNSGPYIQYTFARTQSLLAKKKDVTLSKAKGLDSSPSAQNDINSEELKVLRILIQFENVVGMAGKEFAPNLVCNYLFELSQAYNNFYQKHKVVGSEKEEFRLRLTSAVGITLKNGLFLLGISSPSSM